MSEKPFFEDVDDSIIEYDGICYDLQSDSMSEKRFLTVKSIDNLYSLVDKEKEGKDQIILMSLHKEDLDNIRDLLNHFVDENEQLQNENEQLRQTMQKVCELLEEEVDLFSDKATEHDVIAYREMQDFDNKDAYYICTSTKKAIQMLKGRDSDE